MKILIGLPAYNEEKVIGKVIAEIKKRKQYDILVVDDGSGDKTAAVAKRARVFVVSHFKNQGLGVSIQTALKFAKKNKYDVLVTFDSDGQHDARDIDRVVRPILASHVDICVGVRDLARKEVPTLRKLILWGSNIFTFLLFGIYSSDSQSGFRAFSRRAIETLELKTARMEVSSEIFAEVKKKKLRYAEVPIRVIYTPYSLAKGQKNSNMFRVAWKLMIKLFR